MASIETFFIKECLFGAIMLYILYRVSNDYQVQFKGPLNYVAVRVDADGKEEVYATEPNGMYDFASVKLYKQITEKSARIERYEKVLEDFRGHYTSVMFICISMIYAFLMKLLFRLCQKTRKEL